MTEQNKSTLFALLAVLLWSTVASAFKLSLRYVTPAQLLLGASLASILVLSIVLLLRRELAGSVRTLPRHAKRSFLLGMLNPWLYYLVLFEAYSRLPAQVAQPLNYTWGLTLSLLAAILLKQRLRGRDWWGLGLGYTGVAVLSQASSAGAAHGIDSWGVACALLSALLWASYWLMSARDPRPAAQAQFQNFLCALPLVLGWTLWRDGFAATSASLHEPPALLAMSYVGCFEMGITFVFWQLALVHSQNVARTTTLIYLSPFISLLLIWWTVGEALYPTTFGGLALIMSGLLLQRSARPRTDVSP